MDRHLSRYLLVFIIMTISIKSWSWGRRGHALICETSAYLVGSGNKQKTYFLKSHSFDLGYYCNVPDFIWKRPQTYKKEFVNHFMNLEHFDKQIANDKRRSKDSPFSFSRREFDKKYKDLPPKSGRSWWRIQELVKRVEELTQSLKKAKIKIQERQQLQEQWLLTVGVLGHYIGDLAMPLHVARNHDGQYTKQKGIHHFFEGVMVNELYLDRTFGLQDKVYQAALKQWDAFKKSNDKKSTLLLIQELSRDSQNEVTKLLQLDKRTGRSDKEKAKKAYKDFLVARLTQGVLYQSLLIHRNLNWSFDNSVRLKFNENPSFIDPSKPR